MNLMLYNSLSNQKEHFKPITGKTVKMYSCGPTVYSTPHIGNYRSFLFSDLLHRFLKALGYQVTLVMNITDIDNKTIVGAQQAKVSLKEYTQRYEQEFLADLKTLNFLPAQHYPRASEHIPEMVTMIEALLETGHAYQDQDSIYFKLASFPEYGTLSGIDLSHQQAGASQRVQEDEYSRETISDFALWKAYKQEEDGDIYYETSIGKGRPGWHIECSAMSQKYLGNHFDIHTGGVDNKFPHHENEIAQSICANQSPFVNYWLHAAHLMIESEKMSKSLGNVYTLSELLKNGATPRIIRYMLLSTHYRHTYNFTFANISAADKALTRLGKIYYHIKKQVAAEAPPSPNNTPANSPAKTRVDLPNIIKQKAHAFMTYLSDDLNTSGALGEVFDLTHELNEAVQTQTLDSSTAKQALEFYDLVDNIFGLTLTTLAQDSSETAELFTLETLPQPIQALIAKRNALRTQKEFAEADHVRQELITLGYQIIDTPEKTLIKKTSTAPSSS